MKVLKVLDYRTPKEVFQHLILNSLKLENEPKIQIQKSWLILEICKSIKKYLTNF